MYLHISTTWNVRLAWLMAIENTRSSSWHFLFVDVHTAKGFLAGPNDLCETAGVYRNKLLRKVYFTFSISQVFSVILWGLNSNFGFFAPQCYDFCFSDDHFTKALTKQERPIVCWDAPKKFFFWIASFDQVSYHQLLFQLLFELHKRNPFMTSNSQMFIRKLLIFSSLFLLSNLKYISNKYF